MNKYEALVRVMPHGFVVKTQVFADNYNSIERPKRIKPWWFMAADGTLCLSVFYGSKRIELIPGKNSISVKNMNDLIEALELLKSETEAGSLDRAIENASGALNLNFNKK